MTGTTEPAVDILPCPFCGEMPRSHLFHGDYGGMQIDCMTPNCPASPITTGNSMSDPLIAFNAWNRRAAIVGLNAIPGVSILGAHDGTLPDAVYDAISEPDDAGETIRQLRAQLAAAEARARESSLDALAAYGQAADAHAAQLAAEARIKALEVVLEMTAQAGSFSARTSENATARAEAAEARVMELEAAAKLVIDSPFDTQDGHDALVALMTALTPDTPAM